MAEVDQRVDVAARPKVRARGRSEDRKFIEPVLASETLLLAARWLRHRRVQVTEWPGRSAPPRSQRQRPLDLALEHTRARDFPAQRGASLHVLDRGAAELPRGVLADHELGHPSERFAKAQDRRRVGGGVDYQVQRPALRIEGDELDDAAGTRRDADHLLGIELELRALEFELGPSRRLDGVPAVRRGDDAIVNEADEGLTYGAVVRAECVGTLPQGQAGRWSGRERQQHTKEQVTLASGRHDQNCTQYL